MEDQSTSGSGQKNFARFDDLLRLTEIDPDTLREAEFVQAQMILDTLVGQTVIKATMEEKRIVVETQSGNRYFFYGFMGSGIPRDEES